MTLYDNVYSLSIKDYNTNSYINIKILNIIQTKTLLTRTAIYNILHDLDKLKIQFSANDC